MSAEFLDSPRFVFERSLGKLSARKRPVIAGPSQIAAMFAELGELRREVMLVGAVDCKCRLLHYSVLAIGASDRLGVRIGEAFHGAITTLSTGIFLVHNHPSGSLMPSQADFDLTRDVAQAGLLLGYPLFDHVIVSSEGYCSLLAPKVLRRCRQSVTSVALSQRAGTGGLRVQWECAGCAKQHEIADIETIVAIQRRACVPLRCHACADTSWLTYGYRKTKRASVQTAEPAPKLAAEKTETAE